MRKVEQTRDGSPGGNCNQAAIASLFDRDLDDVPDFMNDVGDPTNPNDTSWFDEFTLWIGTEFGLTVLPVHWELVEPLGLTPTGILTGNVEKGGPNHSVVVKDGEFYWNPAGADYGMIEEPLIVYVFAALARDLEESIRLSNLVHERSGRTHGGLTDDSRRKTGGTLS